MRLMWELDQRLFYFLNHLPHNLYLDAIFTFLSAIGSWGLIWLFIALLLFIWEEIKDKKGFYALILGLGLSILLSNFFLKDIFKRPRPEFSVKETIIVADNRNSFSFPSGHATIAFAAAFVLSKEHKRWKYGYYLVAIMIAFSRIYLGKHYPLDILAGAVLGTGIGYISCRLVMNKKLS